MDAIASNDWIYLILALKSSPGAYKPKIADAKYINEVTNRPYEQLDLVYFTQTE